MKCPRCGLAGPREMRTVIRRLYRTGRGVYGMKALGSGQVTGAEVSVSSHAAPGRAGVRCRIGPASRPTR